MNISYNNVELQLVAVNTVNREAVWTSDNVDLLYVRWLIGVSCLYSPGSTALAFEPNIPIIPQANVVGSNPIPHSIVTGGYTLPISTDRELRNLLFRNRKRLRIWGFDYQGKEKTWLESPTDSATCDADNGPKVHSCNVVSNTGAPANFAVQLEIETCLPPTTNDRPLLSHRWQMTHTHDENYYLTRTIDGEAVFHPGLLDQFRTNPDWFRDQLFHPIPVGFKRLLGPVTLSPDGCVLKYQYQDIDTTVTFDPGDSKATQIHVTEKMAYVSPRFTAGFW